MKVCHLTSVHPPYDTRILLRECTALHRAGHDITLIAPAAHNDTYNEIKIIGVKKRSGRLNRMMFTAYEVYRAALRENADVYHFHDPELLWVGWLLKRKRYKVVYDVHENVPRQIVTKKWLVFPRLVSRLYELAESLLLPGMNVVTAAASNLAPYQSRRVNAIDIENFPDLQALSSLVVVNRSTNPPHVIYIGSVTFDRGIDTMLKAALVLKSLDSNFHFHCVGPCEVSTMDAIAALPFYNDVKSCVTFHGALRQDVAYALTKSCRVGWCVLKPTPNYLRTYSTKIFEYMAVSLPTVAADFDINKKILERYNCGLCVSPTDGDALAEATLRLFNDPDSANSMGANGLNAVKEQFSWEAESKKLIEFYNRLI